MSSSSITSSEFANSDRGFPETCKCGGSIVQRISKTTKNPGRLFFCCANDSGKGGNHLFKWGDEAIVEELVDLKSNVVSYEHVKVRLEKEIEDLKAKFVMCEKSVEEIKLESVRMKKMVIAGFVGLICYLWYSI